MIKNPGLIRPIEAGTSGATCYFRNVELDETIQALIGNSSRYSVLLLADSVGCGAASYEMLASVSGKGIPNIASTDLNYGEVPFNINSIYPVPVDVVYALNVFGYIPKEEHKAIIDTIATYNTKYLCVTHIDRELLSEHYKPVKDNHERIQKNWRHPGKGVEKESYYIWERK